MRSRERMFVQIKGIVGLGLVAVAVVGLLLCAAFNPPKVEAVPSVSDPRRTFIL